MLPALAMAGPVSVWMILFVTIPMLYIIYTSFMSRGVFGDVVYKFSTESYKTILNPTYFKVILKSLKAAGLRRFSVCCWDIRWLILLPISRRIQLRS